MSSYSYVVARLAPLFCLFAMLILGISLNAYAQEESSAKLASEDSYAAKVSGDAHVVSVDNLPPIARSMRIAGPDGLTVKSDSLVLTSGDPLPDGLYNYEIIGALPTGEGKWDAVRNRDNGRSADARPGPATGVIATGHFRIIDGAVFVPGNEKEE